MKAQVELKIALFLFILLIIVVSIPLFLKGNDKITGAVIGIKNDSAQFSESSEDSQNKAIQIQETKTDETTNGTINETINETKEVYNIITSSGSSGSSSSKKSTQKIVNKVENQNGKIEFSAPVDISKLNIKIEKNLISIEPGLNVPATLTISGVYYFAPPTILKDGQPCSECELIDYSNGKVIFNVPHFSTFTTSGCNNLTDDSIINESGNYTICPGVYNVVDLNDDGIIIINASNVLLDCNNSLIVGNLSGIGILANGTTSFNKKENISWADWNDFVNQSSFLENVTITNCAVANFKKGIFAAIHKNLNLTTNIAFNNSETGIFVGGSMNSIIRDNVAYQNVNNESVTNGIVFAASIDSYLINNSVFNNSGNGIGIFAVNNSQIANNSVAYNNESGISIWLLSQNSVFSENNVSFNKNGISISGGVENNSIIDNAIEGNSVGISFSNLWFNFFSVGLSANNSANNISGNLLNNLEYDIKMVNFVSGQKEDCSDKRGWNRFVCDLGNAFVLKVSGNGTVTRNLIENNQFRGNGIYLSRVSGNRITLNNFTNGYLNFEFENINTTNNSIEFNMLNGSLDYGNNPYACNSDVECDDGNPDTKDICNHNSIDYRPFNITVPTCSNYIYNIYGTIVDENGNPAAGVNISFYPASLYDPINDSGNDSALVPKAVPDAVTDENGTYKAFMPYDDSYHMVIQGSSKEDFNLRNNRTKEKIVLPESGFVEVTFEKASAALKSDLYFANATPILLVEKSAVGTQVGLGNFNAGEELKFFVRVNGTPWNLGIYDHYSDTKYATVERLDYDTWRIYFEDLPSNIADWDFNDAVVLVDLLSSQPNASSYDNDCDHDGIKNWDDNNDSECDVGRHDTDVFENNTDFNVEGHIQYSGEYEHVNNYTCGQTLRFSMFGRNFGSTPLNITFVVENHTASGQPTSNRFCENNTDLVYCGNSSDPKETLELPPDGQKYHKLFNFTIPCNLAPADNSTRAKYDIHVYDNIKWGKMHKIGNFFVIKDTTPPTLDAYNKQSYTNLTFNVAYWAEDPSEEGTLLRYLLWWDPKPYENVNVTVDFDINYDSDGDGNASNDADFVGPGGNPWGYNIVYNESGYYTVKYTATDLSGNKVEIYRNHTIYITDLEAKQIFMERAIAHCDAEPQYDVQMVKWDVNGTFDVGSWATTTGLEYRSSEPGSNDSIDFTDSEWAEVLTMTQMVLDGNWEGVGVIFVAGFNPGIYSEIYNKTNAWMNALSNVVYC